MVKSQLGQKDLSTSKMTRKIENFDFLKKIILLDTLFNKSFYFESNGAIFIKIRGSYKNLLVKIKSFNLTLYFE